jgi:hypothetical protein
VTAVGGLYSLARINFYFELGLSCTRTVSMLVLICNLLFYTDVANVGVRTMTKAFQRDPAIRLPKNSPIIPIVPAPYPFETLIVINEELARPSMHGSILFSFCSLFQLPLQNHEINANFRILRRQEKANE